MASFLLEASLKIWKRRENLDYTVNEKLILMLIKLESRIEII